MSQTCPKLSDSGVCKVQGCPYSHNIVVCDECRLPFLSQEACDRHNATTTHSHNAGISILKCTLCSVFCPSYSVYESHVSGRKHQKARVAHGLLGDMEPEPEKVIVPPNCKACDVCRIVVPCHHWDAHVKGRRHILLQRYISLSEAMDGTEDNRYGVEVEGDSVDFGIIDSVEGGATNSFKSLKLTNNGAVTVIFIEARTSSQEQNSAFCIKTGTTRQELNHTDQTSVVIEFTCVEQKGRFQGRLELAFEVPSQRRRFVITRPILATVGDKTDHEVLAAARPYIQHKRGREEEITDIIEGIPPPTAEDIAWANKIGIYDPPKSLISAAFIDNGKPSKIANTIRLNFMKGTFDASTYARHFQVMLWIEEEKAKRELAEYNVEEAVLEPNGTRYELQIDGLAEKRPNVIVGDRILVRECDSQESWYRGFVHDTRERSVLLRFSPKFQGLSGQKYAIRFQLNRTVFRREHQAVLFKPFLSRISFPSGVHSEQLHAVSGAAAESIQLFNRDISSNPPQLRAVATILYLPPGSIPFIVFGPPGTGKTITVVETIRQIVQTNPDARVLACAPSNSAADIIAERLSDLGEKALIRLIAPSRKKASVSKKVMPFTRVSGSGIFVCPPRDELEKFRVVVSTCCNASVPFGIGVKPGHFSHIFIDEAGQATEPEIMIPVKTMADDKTNVILSGDVKQLGPIVRSAVARELGLGVSYLDRLMSNPIYDEVGGNGTTLVKLTKNWRSHPAILKFPNDAFYRGDLQACADPALTHSMCGRWDGLVKKDFPIVFHGISGRDERSGSPSYFNIGEASIVKEYVKSLLDEKGLRLRPEDIGVISPYHAQVCKIRLLIKPFAKDTRVGSVEEYQGQERRVIIISTVRSSSEYIEFDLRHTLGFVANQRRFNVAVTRAQALLIIVGDPYVLALDPLWKEFINYVHIGGGYKGREIDWDPTEPVDRSVRLDEARRAQGLSELEVLIRRTEEADMIDGDGDDVGAFNRAHREEE